MPTLQFNCPVCKKICMAYVDHTTVFPCSSCGTILRPYENGKVETLPEMPKMVKPSPKSTPNPYQNTLTDNFNSTLGPSSVVRKSNKPIRQKDSIWHYVFPILIIVIGLPYLAGLTYDGYKSFKKNNFRKDVKTDRAETAPVAIEKVASRDHKVENEVPVNLSVKKATCYLHVINTVSGTDKTTKCYIDLNEENNELSLQAIDYPAESFKMKYQTGDRGVVFFMFYNQGKLEAKKVLYRRSDLESGDGTLMYLSETGEITISLSN